MLWIKSMYVQTFSPRIIISFSCFFFFFFYTLIETLQTHFSPHAPTTHINTGSGPKAISLSAYGGGDRRLFRRSGCTVLMHVCAVRRRDGRQSALYWWPPHGGNMSKYIHVAAVLNWVWGAGMSASSHTLMLFSLSSPAKKKLKSYQRGRILSQS